MNLGLAIFLIISFSTGIYGLYESMPILFNDFLGGVTGLLNILLPLVFIEFNESGYSEMLTLDLSHNKKIKTLYVNDIYNKKKLTRYFDSKWNIETLQDTLLNVVNSLDLDMNVKVNVVLIKENEDGKLRKVSVERNGEEEVTILIYV